MLVRDGSLVRIRFGAYATAKAVASASDSPTRRLALQIGAAIASMDRSYVASHESAALLHGLSLLKAPPEGALSLTREPDSRARGRRADGLMVHRAALPDAHVTTVDGIRVTTPARTVADLARSLAGHREHPRGLRGPVILVAAHNKYRTESRLLIGTSRNQLEPVGSPALEAR